MDLSRKETFLHHKSLQLFMSMILHRVWIEMQWSG